MSLHSLKALSPLDGRYASQTEALQNIFSEYGLIKYRYIFETEYLKYILKKLFLTTIPPLEFEPLTVTKAISIKAIEAETNHDVKAVEIYIRNQLESSEHKDFANYVHFGLTSQDVNTTAYTLQLKEFTTTLYIPLLTETIAAITNVTTSTQHIPMLSYTHGQVATPSSLNIQLNVYTTRLTTQLSQLKQYQYRTKLGGATGSLNAHKITFPNVKWEREMDKFLKTTFDLTRLTSTTQISHYDDYSELFSIYQRINTILIDFTRDIWQYISMNYLKQIPNPSETGSSTMPHKVNPIDFENAEGNLQISNALLQFLQLKLPVSRLQRDLTDSTTLRNLGTTFGHAYISLIAIKKGLTKIQPHIPTIHKDLISHPEILAEAYQTVLRAVEPPLPQDPYQLFKEFTRGKTDITLPILHEFIDTLSPYVQQNVINYLKSLTPEKYASIAYKLPFHSPLTTSSSPTFPTLSTPPTSATTPLLLTSPLSSSSTLLSTLPSSGASYSTPTSTSTSSSEPEEE